MKNAGIVADGETRLLSAIEAEVRKEYQNELAAASGFWQRMLVKKKITREVRKRLKRVASPHSLWVAQRF
jgi:hypothetical protein